MDEEKACSLCKTSNTICGPLVGPYEWKTFELHFHLYCLYFSWSIWMDISANRDLMKKFFIFPRLSDFSNEELELLSVRLQNVIARYAISTPKCLECQQTRATVSCCLQECSSSYHFPCAISKARFFYCSMASVMVIVFNCFLFLTNYTRRKKILMVLSALIDFSSAIITLNGRLHGQM